MKKTLLSLIVAASFASSATAAVTINFGMGDAYSGPSTGTTPFPSGGLVNLLALESGTWAGTFPDLVSTFSNLTDGFTPAGVTRAAFAGATVNSGLIDAAFNFSYSGNFNAGDELLVVAYPTLTTASSSPGPNTPGFFFRATVVADGSEIAYVAPADGGTYGLFSYTIAQGGSFPNGQFTSGAGAAAGSGSGFIGGGFTTAVPEPSTYALLAISAAAFGGYMLRRRKPA